MTTVQAETTTSNTPATDEIEFIDDLETFGADAVPGCGDDNPYQ